MEIEEIRYPVWRSGNFKGMWNKQKHAYTVWAMCNVWGIDPKCKCDPLHPKLYLSIVDVYFIRIGFLPLEFLFPYYNAETNRFQIGMGDDEFDYLLQKRFDISDDMLYYGIGKGSYSYMYDKYISNGDHKSSLSLHGSDRKHAYKKSPFL